MTVEAWRFPEHKFAETMHRVLSPSNAIQTVELLHGRSKHLDDIRQALYSPGRQVFIYGDRGVGKTSLAQTAAFQRQSTDGFPIAVSCSAGGSCFELVRDIAQEAFPLDPRTRKTTKQKTFKFMFKGAGKSTKASEEQEAFQLPGSLNEAVQMMHFVASNHSSQCCVIIDEFDQVTDPSEQKMFANLVKQIADKKVPISIIFCGIGSSLDDLFSSHLSTHRYFHTAKLDRLSYDFRLEIIDQAARHVQIDTDETTRWRIAMISDGFPHYVHLVTEKLFWRVYRAENGGRVTGDLFEQALHDAVEGLEAEIKKPYDRAAKKYTNACEPILWAAADGDDLQRPSRDIWQSYLRIMKDLRSPPLDKPKFNAQMNNLKKEASGKILTATRAGWYEYTEKVVRGYARLKALQSGIILEKEHPLQQKRFNVYR